MSTHDHGEHLGDHRVLWAVGVNLLLTVAQIVRGIIAGSLALIADAIYNLSDAISLGIAFIARKISRRPPNAQMTFGYGRADIVAALINFTTLIVIGMYLVYQAIWKLIEPQGVNGWLIIVLEPPRDSRILFCLSQAAMARSSRPRAAVGECH